MEYFFELQTDLQNIPVFCSSSLLLRVTQKVLSWPVFLFSAFSSSQQSFWTNWKKGFFLTVVVVYTCDHYRTFFVDTLNNDCVHILKFRLGVCCMICALEEIMADLSEHVKSCSSATTNIISPLLQCLWQPNLAEWLLNVAN